jgi:type II secretory pathway pseudopilin PulG
MIRKIRRASAGYTIVEALVAAAILVIGVAAAASLSLTMVSQEEGNARVARAINLQEQAARLYQLGLSTNTIASLLPTDSGVASITFSASSSNLTNVGTVEIATCRMTFTSGAPLTDTNASINRTNDLTVVRPSIR